MSEAVHRTFWLSEKVDEQHRSGDDFLDINTSSPAAVIGDLPDCFAEISVGHPAREEESVRVLTGTCLELGTMTPRATAIRSQRTTGGSTAPRESQTPTRMSSKNLNLYAERFPSDIEWRTRHRRLSQQSGPSCLASTKILSLNTTSTAEEIDQTSPEHLMTPDQESFKTTRLLVYRATPVREDGSEDLGTLFGSTGGRDGTDDYSGKNRASQHPGPSVAMRQRSRMIDEIDQQVHARPDQMRERDRPPMFGQAHHEQEEKQMHITTLTSRVSMLSPETSNVAISQQMTEKKELVSRTEPTNTLSVSTPSARKCPSCTFQDSSVTASTLSVPEDFSAHARSMCMKPSWYPSMSDLSQALLYPSQEAQSYRDTTKNITPMPPECTANPTLLACPKRLTDPKLLVGPRCLAAAKPLDLPLPQVEPRKVCKPIYHRSQLKTPKAGVQRSRSPQQTHLDRNMSPSNLNCTMYLPSCPRLETTITEVRTSHHYNTSRPGENEAGRLSRLANDLAIRSPLSSPSFSRDGFSDNDDDDDDADYDGYETPTTSPESSPARCIRSSPMPTRHDSSLAPLDGNYDNVGHTQVSEELDTSSSDVVVDTRIRDFIGEMMGEVEDGTYDSTDEDDDNLELIPAGALAAGSKTLNSGDFDGITPPATASPAKGAKSFPFPRANIGVSRQCAAVQRQPSALLRFRQQSAANPRSRLACHPDRFVPARANTANKELLMLSTGLTKPTLDGQHSVQSVPPADPFGPSQRRSFRVTERLSTIRHPASPPRPNLRNGTSLVNSSAPRAFSEGAVWSVGGRMVTEGVASTPNSRGGRVTSGTNAPHHTADFLRKPTTSEEEACHGTRLALAMEINQRTRMMDLGSPTSPNMSSPLNISSTAWRHGVWERDEPVSPTARKLLISCNIVLDAPALRDDYYCSLLAYCPTIQCLAVGLGSHVYLWSEARGARHPNIPDSLTAPYNSHVTSLSFSSQEGASSILAIGRADGKITLWSPMDHDPRFDSEQPAPISCVCFRPRPVPRKSTREPGMMVTAENLLVGDEAGDVYFYSVEWPTQDQRDLFDWHGSMTLLARISCHTQQVCGLAWSSDGHLFATGGNDNQMFLFESKKLFSQASTKKGGQKDDAVSVPSVRSTSTYGTGIGQEQVLNILLGQQRHIFTLNAAVKAIAFAPWQKSLIAAGGGSNDRCIHFFHATSRTSLATIDCHAQVTSLLWSERRKEIAATFGFAQPEHPYRVAVFSWPSCRMVVGIPWWSEERALYAISYPRGPSGGTSDRAARSDRDDAEGRP
nr:putative wd repeat-containing protein c13g6.08 [Quercus suber]